MIGRDPRTMNIYMYQYKGLTIFRKTYCWYDYQIHLFECPCGDGDGCGSSDPNFCRSKPENILIAREGTSRLIYTHVLTPPQHEDIYADHEYLKPVGNY